LGLEYKNIGKVIYNVPQLLGLSVKENMVLTVKFLRSLGVNGPAFLKVLKTIPTILVYTVKGKIQPNVNFFDNIQIQLKDREASNMASIVTDIKCGEEFEAHN
jgi:hypothetical protein